MMTFEQTPDKAREMLQGRTTTRLILDFCATGTMDDPNIPTVRGWIMDELERRNPDAFNAWLDSEPCEDRDLFRFFLKGGAQHVD